MTFDNDGRRRSTNWRRLESEPTHEPGPPMWFFALCAGLAAAVIVSSLLLIGWVVIRVVSATT